MLTEKGFIGPIGDDIPSLIPLLVGLVIFFSTFTVTFNAFEEKNAVFDYDLSVMNIARVLQSNSYVTGYEEFEQHCREIGVVNINYVALITSDWSSGSMGSAGTVFDLSVFEDSLGDKFVCSNNKDATSDEFVSDFIDVEEAGERMVVSRIFPIVVEDEKIVKPMHIVVIAWK